MLLAIDVGNSHAVFGLHNGDRWAAVWRRATRTEETEDELGGWLRSLLTAQDIQPTIDAAVCASVVPSLNQSLLWMCRRWFGVELNFLQGGVSVGLVVKYDPPGSVGADRLANALGALENYRPPLIVVDFGTGTNFDVVDSEGAYIGGAIMPGVLVGSDALFKKAAKLPHVQGLSLTEPERAIGGNTVDSLRSGIVLGYASAIDGLVRRMAEELNAECGVISTGGLGSMFLGVCKTIQHHEPNLTLDGLRVAADRLKN
jgi:type III pantothenate kinase